VARPDWTALLALHGVRCQQAAAIEALEDCEAALGTTLPPALRDLQALSDGLWDEPGEWFVIWPLRDVVQRNRTAWHVEGAQRQEWGGFGDDGTADPFCFRRAGGNAVYYWSPIEQEATLLADDAASFWTALISSTLPPH
jgi:hypothetical protein